VLLIPVLLVLLVLIPVLVVLLVLIPVLVVLVLLLPLLPRFFLSSASPPRPQLKQRLARALARRPRPTARVPGTAGPAAVPRRSTTSRRAG
jgi:hypothetical protein